MIASTYPLYLLITYPLYLLMMRLRRSREANGGIIQLSPGIEEE